ncbi:hypothetical protein Scep_017745 [Stephania cephalantha]|uniref:NHL repeat-containing protein n=1 Tax=Stephania cephalantha TaxID=152367 RepID=A0AAP0IQ46_9MAGN
MASHLSSSLCLSHLLLLLTLHSTPLMVSSSSSSSSSSSDLIIEDGYTVSTVFDGNKFDTPINPSSLLPRTRDFVLLDSPTSVLFSISSPISQDSVVNRLSGNGSNGFADGGLGSAMFSHPRSFVVDLKGNVYVADKANRAIRKISKLGVSTIAGGYSGKTGKKDGTAQYALFSDDFELAFVPDMCALLISDRGNRLIRQMDLKPSDCVIGGNSKLKMGLAWVSLLGVACLILGLVIGFVAHPYVISREVTNHNQLSKIWKHCQINPGKQILTCCSDFRSAVANTSIYKVMDRLLWMSLSHVSLMFRIRRVDKQNVRVRPVSLLDSDCIKEPVTSEPPLMFGDQLKDLICFDGVLDAPKGLSGASELEGYSDVLTCNSKTIDEVIQANISDFDRQAMQFTLPAMGSIVGSSGLVKRR